MAMRRVVYYLFEYNKGLVLKGSKTLLVTTAKWTISRGTAIQWHFVHSNEIDTILQYVEDPRYHVWDVGDARILKLLAKSEHLLCADMMNDYGNAR